MRPRAFVVGLGMVSPLGKNADQSFVNLQRGITGIRPLTLFSPSSKGPLPVGEIDRQFLQEKSNASQLDIPRTHQLAWQASQQALREKPGPIDAIVVGVTTGGMATTEALIRERIEDPKCYQWHSASSVTQYLAQKLICQGPALTVSTACSSGALALKIALELIRKGKKRVLAGGVDALCRLTYYGFGMLKLVDSKGARPFDNTRAGMTVGEAAAFLLIEGSLAPFPGVHGELLGGGVSCDAYHPSAPHPEGLGAVLAIERALEDARLKASQIDYVNLHGTGTRDNDRTEAKAMQRVFTHHQPAMSSTKGTFSHSLAASGALEAVVSLLCLKHEWLPHNSGLKQIDKEIGISPLTTARHHPVEFVMSNSFGFGGNNVVLLFGKANKSPPSGGVGGSRPLRVTTCSCVTGAGGTAESMLQFDKKQNLAGRAFLDDALSSLPPRSLRRMKRLSLITKALVRQIMPCEKKEKIEHVFTGTAWGSLSETYDFLQELFAQKEEFSSPSDFIGSVHNAVAGQAAIWLGAKGANITSTGGDDSFDQALYLTDLFLPDDGSHALVFGAEEAHECLTPLLDQNQKKPVPLSDGGGALLVTREPGSSSLVISPVFLRTLGTRKDEIQALVESLGETERIHDRYSSLWVGIPGGQRDLAEEQLRLFLTLSGFQGQVVDYRKWIGQHSAASAVATVLAVLALQKKISPEWWIKGRADEKRGAGILLLGLGTQLSAIGLYHG